MDEGASARSAPTRSMASCLAIVAGTVFVLLTAEDVISSIAVPYRECSQYDEDSRSPEERCGFTESITYRVLDATVEWIDRRHDFVTAASTFFIGLFTLTLWWSTRAMLRVANDSIKLAREEFVSTHRPRIILREAFIGSVLEGEPINVMLHFANIGETKGTIVNSSVSVEIFSVDRLLLHPTVDVKNDLGLIELAGGAADLVPSPGETPKWEGARYEPQIHGPAETGRLLTRATILGSGRQGCKSCR